MSGYRFNRVRNATLKSLAYHPPPTPFVPHCPLTGCPQQAWESDRARREVNGQPAPRFRVSRVTSRLSARPRRSHVEDNQTEEEQHDDTSDPSTGNRQNRLPGRL